MPSMFFVFCFFYLQARRVKRARAMSPGPTIVTVAMATGAAPAVEPGDNAALICTRRAFSLQTRCDWRSVGLPETLQVAETSAVCSFVSHRRAPLERERERESVNGGDSVT